MSKVKAIGNGAVQVGETIYNLKAFKQITKYEFALFEHGFDEEGPRWGICVVPIVPTAQDVEDGVDGSSFIATYMENEQSDFESDFDTITKAYK